MSTTTPQAQPKKPFSLVNFLLKNTPKQTTAPTVENQPNNTGAKYEKPLPNTKRSPQTNAFLKSIGLAGGKRKTMRRKARKGRKATRKH